MTTLSPDVCPSPKSQSNSNAPGSGVSKLYICSFVSKNDKVIRIQSEIGRDT
jgi:hypothetical protein